MKKSCEHDNRTGRDSSHTDDFHHNPANVRNDEDRNESKFATVIRTTKTIMRAATA